MNSNWTLPAGTSGQTLPTVSQDPKYGSPDRTQTDFRFRQERRAVCCVGDLWDTDCVCCVGRSLFIALKVILQRYVLPLHIAPVLKQFQYNLRKVKSLPKK